MWINRRHAASSTLLATETDSSHRPRYRLPSTMRTNACTHTFTPRIAPHISYIRGLMLFALTLYFVIRKTIISATDSSFVLFAGCWTFSRGSLRLGSVISEMVFLLFRMYSKAALYLKYIPGRFHSIATSIHDWEFRENQCQSEVERKSEAGLPTGQRCIVGYRWVPGAALAHWANTSAAILLTKPETTPHLSKVDRYFIILWEEICFHGQ